MAQSVGLLSYGLFAPPPYGYDGNHVGNYGYDYNNHNVVDNYKSDLVLQLLDLIIREKHTQIRQGLALRSSIRFFHSILGCKIDCKGEKEDADQ